MDLESKTCSMTCRLTWSGCAPLRVWRAMWLARIDRKIAQLVQRQAEATEATSAHLSAGHAANLEQRTSDREPSLMICTAATAEDDAVKDLDVTNR
ncbi:hypothetical protein ABZV75_37760 [Streptomyces flaveolus]|uniref:hypothetical protein n=1 Tax=Streptomyces flaveolus TaxID=67297 RepID=UPI0033A54E9A